MSKGHRLYIFIAVRSAFFSQVVVGTAVNLLLLLFMLTFLLRRRPKPTDLTVAHLALAHLLMLLIRVFLDTDVVGAQGAWSDATCAAVIYLYRLGRSLSLCTTCLLSVLQAITLSPGSSFLAKFKGPSAQHSLLLVLWVLSVVINVRILVSIEGPANETSAFWFTSESCSVSPAGLHFRALFSLIGILRDVALIGLMALSSGYMVALLCRHRRRSQHLHCTSLAPKASPELRATRTILLLMGFFVAMYFLDCIVSSSSEKVQKKDPVLLLAQMLVGNGYATVSALMLISTEKRITKLFQPTLARGRRCVCRAG